MIHAKPEAAAGIDSGGDSSRSVLERWSTETAPDAPRSNVSRNAGHSSLLRREFCLAERMSRLSRRALVWFDMENPGPL